MIYFKIKNIAVLNSETLRIYKISINQIEKNHFVYFSRVKFAYLDLLLSLEVSI